MNTFDSDVLRTLIEGLAANLIFEGLKYGWRLAVVFLRTRMTPDVAEALKSQQEDEVLSAP